MLAPAAAVSLLLLTQTTATPLAVEASPPPAPLPSTLSAEPLREAGVLEAAAGWPRLRLGYAQGVSRSLDLGLFSELDYSTTELRTGGTLRTPLAPAGGFARALRLSVAWYRNFGGGLWLHPRNRSDAGVDLGLGLTWSRRTGSGEVSLLADLPLTFTLRREGGLLLAPRAAVAYQAPLYGPFTVGLQLGAGLRWGIGDAPLKRGSADLSLLALAGCRGP
jgi:hypothetical protein